MGDPVQSKVGVSPGVLLDLLAKDVSAFSARYQVTWSPDEPRALDLVGTRLGMGGDRGLIVTALESLGADTGVQDSPGHVVPMNMATYIVLDLGLDIAMYPAALDRVSEVTARIMTYGFPERYTGVTQSFQGLRSIDVRALDANKRLGVWRVAHSVWVALQGGPANVCSPITAPHKVALVGQGWRFGEIVNK